MSTNIRTELSPNNKYYIDKERRLELKHFCLQYNDWKKSVEAISMIPISNPESPLTKEIDPRMSQVEKCARLREYCLKHMKMVERAAQLTDPILGDYILKAVTNGFSYDVLNSRLPVPCGKELFYEYYHRFFFILSWLRQ